MIAGPKPARAGGSAASAGHASAVGGSSDGSAPTNLVLLVGGAADEHEVRDPDCRIASRELRALERHDDEERGQPRRGDVPRGSATGLMAQKSERFGETVRRVTS